MSNHHQAASRIRRFHIGFMLLCLLSIPSITLAAAAPVGDTPSQDPPHPPPVYLWLDGAPGSQTRKGDKETYLYHVGQNYSYTAASNIHHPSITPYLPDKQKATGAAVIIAPGGGHRFLAIDHEGYDIGKWLAERGIAGFVLKYRLARGSGDAGYTVADESLADMQRAIRVIRSRSAEWNINPDAVGVMGFSAGGEIAALASMKYDTGKPDSADPVERLGSKPSFQVLMYPGNSRSIVPDKDSPPAFLACAADDRVDISEGLANAYLLFHKAGVPVDLHIYGSSGHGFGLALYKPNMLAAAWPTQFEAWLADRKFLKRP